MKILIFVFFIGIFNSIYCQEGIYNYADKDGTEEELELLPNNSFQYFKKGKWSKQKAKGTWKKEDNKIILTTEYRLSNILVKEEVLDTLGITIEVQSKTEAPRRINKISLNRGEILMNYDSDFAMEMMEKRHQALQKIQKDQNSIDKFIPVRYAYDRNMAVKQIELEFDGKKTAYLVENPSANFFTLVFQLAPDENYPYFEEETFIFQNKYLMQGTKKWKKQK